MDFSPQRIHIPVETCWITHIHTYTLIHTVRFSLGGDSRKSNLNTSSWLNKWKRAPKQQINLSQLLSVLLKLIHSLFGVKFSRPSQIYLLTYKARLSPCLLLKRFYCIMCSILNTFQSWLRGTLEAGGLYTGNIILVDRTEKWLCFKERISSCFIYIIELSEVYSLVKDKRLSSPKYTWHIWKSGGMFGVFRSDHPWLPHLSGSNINCWDVQGCHKGSAYPYF